MKNGMLPLPHSCDDTILADGPAEEAIAEIERLISELGEVRMKMMHNVEQLQDW